MREISGKVISTKMKDTAVVEITRFIAHPVYKKRIRRSKKLHAHNEIGAKTGQRVILVQTRPVSKTKFWKISGVAGEK